MLQSLLYSMDSKKEKKRRNKEESVELNWDEFLNYAKVDCLTMTNSYFAPFPCRVPISC